MTFFALLLSRVFFCMVQPDKPDRSRKCAFEVWGACEIRLSLMCQIYAYITNLNHCVWVSLDAGRQSPWVSSLTEHLIFVHPHMPISESGAFPKPCMNRTGVRLAFFLFFSYHGYLEWAFKRKFNVSQAKKNANWSKLYAMFGSYILILNEYLLARLIVLNRLFYSCPKHNHYCWEASASWKANLWLTVKFA